MCGVEIKQETLNALKFVNMETRVLNIMRTILLQQQTMSGVFCFQIVSELT